MKYIEARWEEEYRRDAKAKLEKVVSDSDLLEPL